MGHWRKPSPMEQLRARYIGSIPNYQKANRNTSSAICRKIVFTIFYANILVAILVNILLVDQGEDKTDRIIRSVGYFFIILCCIMSLYAQALNVAQGVSSRAEMVLNYKHEQQFRMFHFYYTPHDAFNMRQLFGLLLTLCAIPHYETIAADVGLLKQVAEIKDKQLQREAVLTYMSDRAANLYCYLTILINALVFSSLLVVFNMIRVIVSVLQRIVDWRMIKKALRAENSKRRPACDKTHHSAADCAGGAAPAPTSE